MPRERIRSVAIPNNAGPIAVPLRFQVADNFALSLAGWISSFGSSNVWIFEGRLSTAECQGRLAGADNAVDGVCLTSGNMVEWTPDQDERDYTVFFQATNTSGQAQGVTLIMREFIK